MTPFGRKRGWEYDWDGHSESIRDLNPSTHAYKSRARRDGLRAIHEQRKDVTMSEICRDVTLQL